MIDHLIKIIRIPFMILSSAIYIIVIFFGLILESIVVIISFVFLSLFRDKKYIQGTWVGSYPNSINNFVKVEVFFVRWALLRLEKEDKIKDLFVPSQSFFLVAGSVETLAIFLTYYTGGLLWFLTLIVPMFLFLNDAHSIKRNGNSS